MRTLRFIISSQSTRGPINHSRTALFALSVLCFTRKIPTGSTWEHRVWRIVRLRREGQGVFNLACRDFLSVRQRITCENITACNVTERLSPLHTSAHALGRTQYQTANRLILFTRCRFVADQHRRLRSVVRARQC